MADLSGASIATKEYADNVSKANEQLMGMNSSYTRAVSALESLSETTESFKETTSRVTSLNATLNDNLVSETLVEANKASFRPPHPSHAEDLEYGSPV